MRGVLILAMVLGCASSRLDAAVVATNDARTVGEAAGVVLHEVCTHGYRKVQTKPELDAPLARTPRIGQRMRLSWRQSRLPAFEVRRTSTK